MVDSWLKMVLPRVLGMRKSCNFNYLHSFIFLVSSFNRVQQFVNFGAPSFLFPRKMRGFFVAKYEKGGKS